ncbi:MAG: hypothetical protein IT371_09735 [Deltaproteobacteria bacterium]|nr:hypothetical protein [Deltaproteobacteria bacterium]
MSASSGTYASRPRPTRLASRTLVALLCASVTATVAPTLANGTPRAAEAAPPRSSGATEPRFEFLAPFRSISLNASASRDTPAVGVVFLPRTVLSAGGQFSVFTLRAAGLTSRLGIYGMVELDGNNSTTVGFPWFNGDVRFWRGLFGYSVAIAFDRLARRWCDRGCALEASVSFRHESDHLTASNSSGEGTTEYLTSSQVGDCIMLDAAARYPLGRFEFTASLRHKFFLPGRSSYSHGPGVELIARWRRFRYLHPFVSFFAEYLVGVRTVPADRRTQYGTRGFPDAYLVRSLLGVAVPSRVGDIYLFADGTVGHRKGLAVFTEEATLGGGVRFAFP